MGWLFGDDRRMRRLVSGLRFYQRTGLASLVRRTGVLRLLKMEELEAMMPPVSRRSLIPGREWWPADGTAAAQLFNGCIMGTVFADTNRAAARVMAHNGTTVDLPAGQQCCGALHVHSGMMADARVLARKNIDTFACDGDEPIIVTAAGCGAALKEYGFLLKDDPDYAERAKAFSARVRDVTEYLGERELVPPTVAVERTVTYQEPCHLAHAQRISTQPRQLLAAVPGLTLVEMRESSLCCGSAGIYNLIRREMANDLGDRKAKHVLETPANDVVTANPGCAMQLRSSLQRNGSQMRVRHIVDVLDEAYGGAKSKCAWVKRPAPATNRSSRRATASSSDERR